jgi:hypothetical protein
MSECSDPWGMHDDPSDDAGAAARTVGGGAQSSGHGHAVCPKRSRSPDNPGVADSSPSRSRSPVPATDRFFPELSHPNITGRTVPRPRALPGTEWYMGPLWGSVQHMRNKMPDNPVRPMVHESMCSGTLMELFGFQVRLE